jgi:hypothetical protein
MNQPMCLYPSSELWRERARAFLMEKWRERAAELGRREPTNLFTACKFASLFAQYLFGGELRGNWHHQYLVLPGGEEIDLTGNDVAPKHHDSGFWMNPEHRESMRSIEPRVTSWVAEFRQRFPVS